jgi:hypothetical protein
LSDSEYPRDYPPKAQNPRPISQLQPSTSHKYFDSKPANTDPNPRPIGGTP